MTQVCCAWKISLLKLMMFKENCEKKILCIDFEGKVILFSGAFEVCYFVISRCHFSKELRLGLGWMTCLHSKKWEMAQQKLILPSPKIWNNFPLLPIGKALIENTLYTVHRKNPQSWYGLECKIQAYLGKSCCCC